MQYSKLYNNPPTKSMLTDKYLVRKWVSTKIGEDYLIPLIGVWDNFSEINFDNHPKQFILKTNHGVGTNVIVKNKEKFNYYRTKIKFNRWMKMNFSHNLALHYKEIEPKIIAENFIQDSEGNLNDYKFLCFHGEVYYCWVDIDRNNNHKRNVYNLNWDLQDWNQHTYPNTESKLEKPENFDEMVEIAKILCQGFSHVRVDLYNVDGKIFFGELTFSNSSGFELIYPHSANQMLGNLWRLPMDKKK